MGGRLVQRGTPIVHTIVDVEDDFGVLDIVEVY